MAKRICVGIATSARSGYRSVDDTVKFERDCEAECKTCRHVPTNTKHELTLDRWIVTCKCSWPEGWIDCNYGCTLLVIDVESRE